jgi:hypothetical protein
MRRPRSFRPTIAIIEGKTAQGFSYLSGGISSDEPEIVEMGGKSHNVNLVFADKSGAYLAYIKLVIRDAKQQEIITLRETGPWFYIQLPPGHLSCAGERRRQDPRTSPSRGERQEDVPRVCLGPGVVGQAMTLDARLRFRLVSIA